jgi:hypothetical protein
MGDRGRILQRFVHADTAVENEDTEGLLNAINATLVHLRVRQAARLDSGIPSDELIASMKRNKLKVIKWAGDDEPIVIHASDKASQKLCDQLCQLPLNGDEADIMGRLLGYGCDFDKGMPIDKCWMINFIVYIRCSDNISRLDNNWLGGFKCCKKKIDLMTLLSKYNKEFVGPANYHLAGTSVSSGKTRYLIDHFAIELEPPHKSKR